MKKSTLLFAFLFSFYFSISQWEVVYENPDYSFWSINFINNDTGFVAGRENAGFLELYGFIMKTTDGGNNWNLVFKTGLNGLSPMSFNFMNDSILFTGFQDGVIYKSTDCGDNWEYLSIIPGLWNIESLKFINDKMAYALWDKSTDGGITWVETGMGYLNDYSFSNDSTGIISTGDGLYYTSNSGDSWQKVDPGANIGYISVSMNSQFTGMATDWNKNFYKTTDGGISWQLYHPQIPITLFDNVNKIYFANANLGFMQVGNKFLKTDDGGMTWEYILFSNDNNCADIVATENGTLWTASADGRILSYQDGSGNSLESKYASVEWFSRISGQSIITTGSFVDSVGNPGFVGVFSDSIKVENNVELTSTNPENENIFILKYNTDGSLNYSSVIETSLPKNQIKYSAVDNDNNLYLFTYTNWLNLSSYFLRKYTEDGDSIWAIELEKDSFHITSLTTTGDGNINLLGTFTGTFSFEGSSIQTDFQGLFRLKIDQDGNLVEFTKLAETEYSYNPFSGMNYDGLFFFSFKSPTSVWIDADTLGKNCYHILFFNEENDLMWYNDEFNFQPDYVCDISCKTISRIYILAVKEINDSIFNVLYEYDEAGNKTKQIFIEMDGLGVQNLTETSNKQLLVSTSFNHFISMDETTLYGFGHYNKAFFTLSNNFEVLEGSTIRGINTINNVLEFNQNLYIVGRKTNYDIIFANDTILQSPHFDYFVAKLTHEPNFTHENQLRNSFTVFPNPSAGIFEIQLQLEKNLDSFITVYN
ncbi:MAG: hypothetical protein KDC05_17310, partial [Bacteroidales bacterium]|nr:hypothetical protein [Bacteroidales bacterium]